MRIVTAALHADVIDVFLVEHLGACALHGREERNDRHERERCVHVRGEHAVPRQSTAEGDRCPPLLRREPSQRVGAEHRDPDHPERFRVNRMRGIFEECDDQPEPDAVVEDCEQHDVRVLTALFAPECLHHEHRERDVRGGRDDPAPARRLVEVRPAHEDLGQHEEGGDGSQDAAEGAKPDVGCARERPQLAAGQEVFDHLLHGEPEEDCHDDVVGYELEVDRVVRDLEPPAALNERCVLSVSGIRHKQSSDHPPKERQREPRCGAVALTNDPENRMHAIFLSAARPLFSCSTTCR